MSTDNTGHECPGKGVGLRKGRPVDTAKRDAILDAAVDQFFDVGFAASSIERIAEIAGVSKVTVYNQFGGKEALFKAAVEAECEKMRGRMLPEIDDVPLAQRLAMIAHGMHGFLFRPNMLRFERRLASEAERHPELGRTFLESGPRRMKAALADVMRRAAARGELELDDPELAAEQFAGMVKGMADLEWRFAGEHDPAVNQRRIDAAVETFLRAYAA